MHHIFSSIINLVIPFDDKRDPEDLNACKGDKASASLNSKIEAVNLRGNINLFEASVSVLSLCEMQDRCVYLSWKTILKPEISYIPDWAAIWHEAEVSVA